MSDDYEYTVPQKRGRMLKVGLVPAGKERLPVIVIKDLANPTDPGVWIEPDEIDDLIAVLNIFKRKTEEL